MVERKLSEELKYCLGKKHCGECRHYEEDTALTCPELLQKAYEVIKGYEDLEEQGRLLVMAYEVKKCRIAKCPERECTCQKAREYSVQEVWIRPELFGDGFYRTEEEAEQALAEMEEGAYV